MRPRCDRLIMVSDLRTSTSDRLLRTVSFLGVWSKFSSSCWAGNMGSGGSGDFGGNGNFRFLACPSSALRSFSTASSCRRSLLRPLGDRIDAWSLLPSSLVLLFVSGGSCDLSSPCVGSLGRSDNPASALLLAGGPTRLVLSVAASASIAHDESSAPCRGRAV